MFNFLIINYCFYFKISNWTKFVSNASSDVFALVIKSPEKKFSNRQLNEFKKLISTNYPGVKFSLINIKSLDTINENIRSVIQEIDVAGVVASENISEHDIVAIASGPKYKAVS